MLLPARPLFFNSTDDSHEGDRVEQSLFHTFPSPVNFIRGWVGFVSSVAVVNKHKHVINAVMATVIARMRVWTKMAA